MLWIVVLKTLESPLDCTEIKPVNPKGNQPCIFLERTVAGADTLTTWCEEPSAHWKRSWCWERLKAKGEESSRDEMVRQHHWLSGHEGEQTPGVSGGQGGLTCHIPWGRKELGMTMTEQQQAASRLIFDQATGHHNLAKLIHEIYYHKLFY